MTKKICIYHANCADGFTAAWAVRMALVTGVEFIPAGYGDAPPDVTGADVIIVDFSYKRAVLMDMAKTARSILILDHHKTAEADLAGLPMPHTNGWTDHISGLALEIENGRDPRHPRALFDMNRSGAQLAWDYFCGGRGTSPQLVEYVADRDLWKFELPYSREINAVIQSHEMTFNVWESLAMSLDDQFDNVVLEGAAILRAHDKLVRSVIATSRRTMVIGGLRVPVAAAPYALASDTAGTMAEGEPFAATYVDGPKGRAFSLRSRAGCVDVSEIAQAYGGGGHRGAAGFLMPLGWEGE